MKKIALVCIALCFALISNSQSSWQWGKRGGSGGSGTGAYADERVIDMATDRNGNVYALAVNNPGLANVDGRTGRTVRDRLTIASWSCNGTFRWMKNIGGASSTIGRALGVDSLDGVYVTGTTSSTNSLAYSYFDSDSTLGNTNKSLFTVKYDTSGTLKWLRMPQPDTVGIFNRSRSLDMAVTPNGEVFWYTFLEPGNYNGVAFNITSPGYYIIRYNAAGIYQGIVNLSMTTTGGGNPANLNGITNAESSRLSHDANSGRFYLTGQYDNTYGTLAFGSTTINAIGTIGALPIYLAAFSSSGSMLWVKQSSPTLYASTRNCRPVIDPQGNVYIGGDIATGNTFAGQTFTNNLSIHNFPFVMSLDANGNSRWISSGKPKDGASAGYSIAYSQNAIGMAGYYGGLVKWDADSIVAPLTMSGTSYILLTRLNAATGSIIGMDSIASQSTLNNYATSITGDRKGNFFVGGSFDYRLFPGRDTIATVGGTYDWFVAKFGSSQCSCAAPVANFTISNIGGNLMDFTYNGTTPVTSATWNFGDGSPTATTVNTSHNYSTPGTYTVCVTITNDCGSHTYCRSVTTGSVGVAQVSGLSEINAYPNPVAQYLTINQTIPETKMEIYNPTGSRVFQATLHGTKEQVDVSNLPAGLYLIRLTSTDGRQNIKQFVKQ